MIYFKRISYENFLSTGNVATEYEFDASRTTLFIGENGAGKSTILDALCFVLYGKPYRPINKSQLINSINKKGTKVEIEFTSFDVPYKVIRGIKPNVFEVYKDGELIDQDVDARDYQRSFEENVLKINFKAFTQVVVLGKTNFVPFMQLNTAERRTIVEELLDIGVFSEMAKHAKEDSKENKNELVLVDKDLESNRTRLEDSIRHNAVVSKGNSDKIDTLKEEIENFENKIETYTTQQNEFKEKYDEKRLKELDSLSVDIEKQIKEEETSWEKGVSYISDVTSKISAIDSQIKVYENQPTDCPECGMPLEVTDFSDKIAELNVKRNKLATLRTKALGRRDEIKKNRDSLKTKLTELQSEKHNITSLKSKIEGIQTQIDASEYYIKDRNKQIVSLQEETQSLINVEPIEENLKLFEHKRNKLEKEKETIDFVVSILKDDGIKAEIVKKYIPLINKYINYYLDQLEFFVSFELDDQFNETIKSRHRDTFSFTSFSEGQKMRINLAILFTWREIARLRNSMNTNLLIMDEVLDSSLDMEGIDQFMKIIQGLTESTNVLIISHRQDLDLHFQRTIKFVENKNFSSYSEVSK